MATPLQNTLSRTLMNGNLTINGNISVNSSNIALGLNAAAGTVGTNTVAIGTQAGQTNLGTDSVAIGYLTSATRLGNYSTSVGSNAGYNQTGSYNTFIGREAGYDSQQQRTGSNNTYLGYNTSANGSYSNSTAIGSGASITANNQIVLGTASETVSIPGAIAPFARENFTNMLSVTSSGKLVSRYSMHYIFPAGGSGAAQMPLPFSSYISTTSGAYVVSMRGGGSNGVYYFFVLYNNSSVAMGANIGIVTTDGFASYPTVSGGYLRWEYRALPNSVWGVTVEILPFLGY